MGKRKKGKKCGGHHFYEPNSYRTINCKRIPGERARKQCRKWNKFVSQRSKLKQQGLFEEMKQLEAEYYGLQEIKETAIESEYFAQEFTID